MVRTERKIPTGWETYSPIGSVIEGTRIFAFKTPLHYDLQKHITKNQRFTTSELFRKLAENGQTLGLVINCSNTRRYYDKEDIEGMMVEYKELLCPGRGFLIRRDLVKDFIKVIDDFLLQNRDNDLLVGVHCGDGINRTGYLICSYLISSLGWSSHLALNAFEYSRGFPIQRGSYIQTLHKTDSERRLKTQHSEGRIKKVDKRLAEQSALSRADEPDLNAQMLQQFYQIEQQFKQVANSTLMEPASQIPNIYSSSVNPSQSISSAYTQNYDMHMPRSSKEQVSQPFAIDEDISEDDNDEEMDESSPNAIDFDSMGRVDMKDVSKSHQRRQRRQKREKLFHVMKKGRFWEINAMQNQMKK